MPTLRIERHFDAPIDQVWHAFTDSTSLAAWLWPPGWETTVTADVRVGGTYAVDAPHAPGGGMGVRGTYLDIAAPHRLVFTWQWHGETSETTVTIALSEADGGTDLVLVHEGFADTSEAGQHEQGWNDCLDRLPAWAAASAG
jgi:uncharacterized protein YndB with AHSA1/START domain